MDNSNGELNKELWIGDNMQFEIEIEPNANVQSETVTEEQCGASNDGESDNVFKPQVAIELTPKIGQEFQTLDEAKLFYNEYAKEVGFSVRISSGKKSRVTNELTKKVFVCFKQGKATLFADADTCRRRGSVREDCKEKLAILRSPNDTFVVSLFEVGHSHPLCTPRKIHLLRSHRRVSNAQKCLTQQLGMINIPVNQQFNLLGVQAGGFQNIGCTQRDLYNLERDRSNELKGHDGDMLHEFFILKQGKNPTFAFQIETGDEQRIKHCFWVDATSRRAYSCYGDVVIFDTTYNTNRYGLIFAPLMGVNNHGQTIVFGCAFLSDETIDSFVWLFNTFLKSMSEDAPKMIITDQDPAMTKAIMVALPHTYHRYCSWHIVMKFSEKVDAVKYSAYNREFSDCIWNSKTKEEFESKWHDLLTKSQLTDNKWLHSMYEIRSRWVPTYVNHVFSANMSSSQRAESGNSFFKKYVSKTNSLVDFLIQFGRGLMQQRHEEFLADHKDLTEKPKLKSFDYVLVQMVNIYTREIFYKFQDEMWEFTSYKFEVVKEDENQIVYEIRRKYEAQKVREIIYDKNLNFASCTCNMFESSGIPCRHVLAYLQKFHDFEKLPSQYILKRWTKAAKPAMVTDASGIEITDDKSYFLQRSRLIQRSLDVVDKALTSPEATQIYNDTLDIALEKINQLSINGSIVQANVRPSNPTLIGTSCGASVNMNEHIYNEPQKVRAKGCGKRLKGGKENAMRRAKKSKDRRCNGCGLVGQAHDKRNCLLLINRSEDATQDESPGDQSDSFIDTPM